MPLALLALILGAFAIGTTEFVIVGLIPNIAAFNLGVAGGSWAGGLVVTHLGLGHTPWVGALVVLGAFGLTALSGWLDRRDGLPDRASGAVVVAH